MSDINKQNSTKPNNISAKDASWNKQFNKTNKNGKNSLKSSISSKTKDLEEKAMTMANKGSLKGKLIAEAIKRPRELKNNVLLRINRIINFITINLKLILIPLLLALIIGNGLILGYSIIQSTGKTPHYYCDIDADKGTKRSKMYQQYCTNGSTDFTLDNINGHYVVQDGSGPCTDCACLNLLLRYYTSKEINLYDYMWDNTGQFIADNNALSLDTSIGSKSLRRYIAASGTTTCSNKNLSRGSKWFAKKHPTKNISNSNNFTKADWGYVRDETLSFEGLNLTEAAKTDEAKNIANNDNWVWDLSCETTWSAQWADDNYITINNVTATWEEPARWKNADELKTLLTKHPSGVVAYRNYGSGKHAILITGWNEEENCFNVVDSALATSGGFEGPAISSNFLVQSCWNESQIESCANVEKLVVIKEDTAQ